MRPSLRMVAVLSGLGLLASACGDDDTAASGNGAPDTGVEVLGVTTLAPPETTTQATFPPAEQDGDLISVEPLDIGDLGVAYRVVYRSHSVEGEPIEVSGIIAAPDAAATAPDRPVFAIAHGTTGMGDSCAPSANFGTFEENFIAPYLAAGYVVAATDFEGLGTPGLHPYIVGESEARGVIDSVRAARNMTDLGASDQVVVWGHSQGGHAALHTAARWGELAPELDLLGVAAGAPPSQFGLLSDFLKGSPFQGYIVMVAAGMAAAYSELDLEAILTDTGEAGLTVLESGCSREIFDYYNPLTYEEIVAVPDIYADPVWSARLQENDSNQLPVAAPLIILHGGADEQIPTASSEVLLGQLCALGSTAIERRVYDGFGHAEAVTVYADELQAWVADRIAGAAPINQCPTADR